jgi:uncharacterized protein YndB with AHSA1/START domain
MSGRTRGYAHRIDIAAGAAPVWRALTDTESLRKWCSPDAQINAKQGGHFRASVDRVTELEAHIDILLPERRMRLIYLPSEDLPQHGSPIVEDFILDNTDSSKTILRLLGSGFPTDQESDTPYMRLRTGWERAVARLKVLVEQTLRENA